MRAHDKLIMKLIEHKNTAIELTQDEIRVIISALRISNAIDDELDKILGLDKPKGS